MKVKKENEKKPKIKREKAISPGVWAAALLATIIVYLIMLNVEKNALADFEKGSIYMTIKQLPEGMMITEENYREYFELKNIDVKLIPDKAVKTLEQLHGLIPCTDIDEGVVITSGMFENIDDITAGMEEPVIAGFRCEDLYQVVGGVLRAGDRIHIYKVSTDGNAELAWENVFIQGVFDQSGKAITNADSSTSAARINVYMDKKDIEAFYSSFTSGTLRVVKVCE